jgi:hypothetical protein
MDKTLNLQPAILKTLCYADVFDYPLTAEEIYHYLINNSEANHLRGVTPLKNLIKLTPRMVESSLKRMLQKSHPSIDKVGKYFTLKGRSEIVLLRKKRRKFAQQKLKIAQRVAEWLRLLPTIKMVAITGALAMENPDEADDIDLLLVTKKNQLWFTRLLVIPLVSLIAKRRKPTRYKDNETMPVLSKVEGKQWNNAVCLNIFLDETALAIPKNKRNLYTAHEVAQARPLWSIDNTYEKFLTQNCWVNKYLPNVEIDNNRELKTKKQESTLLITFYSLFSIFETLAFKSQLNYMRSKMTSEVVTPHSAFFHPRNTAKLVLNQYRSRLNRYQKFEIFN